MSISTILWLAALGSSAVIVTHWIFLRSRYLKGITEQRARHQQQQQATHQQLDLAKQQIGRLQSDLNIIRLQLKRPAARQTSVSQARTPDEAPAARSALPPDGFADTLPTPQFPHDIPLLKR